MTFIRRSLATVVVCFTCGCTTFSSTMLNRLDDGSFVGNSNGTARHNNSARPYKGIPITLHVPTHLDVYIEETYYLQEESGKEFSEVNTGRLLNVRAEPIKTKKVFLVDFKRPASGTLEMGAKFNDQQYFDKIESKLVDTTIIDSAKLLNTVLKFATAKPAAFNPSTLPRHLRQTRVVAYRRFDINEPDYEQQVEAFVNLHLNDCDRCFQSPDYDP